MRWQKVARAAIALFVVAFAGFVFFKMRQRGTVATPVEEISRADPEANVEGGPGSQEFTRDGKLAFKLDFKKHLIYKGGRVRFFGVTLILPDRDGRTITVTGDVGEAVAPPGQKTDLTVAKITGNVRLTTDNGIVMTAAEATYDGTQGVLKVPGAVEFTRGRMKGTGVGATYDRTRDVLWILDQAHVTVTPDSSGAGAIDATSASAGLARAENYAKLVTNARIVSDGRTAEADEITAMLDEKGEKIQQLQLREKSRITGTGTSSGAQLMTARHIDMTYLPDGRTLQHSKLVENGVVELPGSAGAPGPRITGNTIDIAMSPDGATVTALNAQDKVQVDLPAEGTTPAKQIRSATLRATGTPGQGIQNAVFEGGVEYSESRPAGEKSPAVERTSRSLRLVIDTKPGLGAVQRADFRGNARFVDGEITADAPRALYDIERDQLDLSPSAGDPGTGPLLNDRQLTVQARNIRVSPSTSKLSADTDVRSIIKPRPRPPGGAPPAKGRSGPQPDASQTRMPAMLKQDKPVNVTSNRLEYDGVSQATYSGKALLWQDRSRISADTIIVNDQSGNLTARTDVRTTMMLEDEDPKTKVKTPTETKVSADLLVYEDAKRLAAYTGRDTTQARLTSAQGDITGDRIDLYLKEGGNELERAESDGKVAVKLELLYATGAHIVYTAATDTHVLTGQPVVAIQKDEKGACTRSEGTILTYRRSVGSILEAMPGLAPSRSKPVDPCPAELRH